MKIFVGVTDNQWFNYLRSLNTFAPLDEVNFWQPRPDNQFRTINPGDLFLFKLHRSLETSGKDLIAGGGVFASYSILPVSLAWETFGETNGAGSFSELRRQIVHYRRETDRPFDDFKIGCIIITQPFFLNEEEWFPVPGWSTPIVRGKTYYLEQEAGQFIWKHLFQIWEQRKIFDLDKEAKRIEEERRRYGKETIIRPRLGQGAFRVAVTDAYRRACAITTEHALPVLEAAHIKPFNLNGPHEVFNGLLLRTDFHRLFDRGYITITPEYRIEVSSKLKEDFENGKSYYPFHGKPLNNLPRNPADYPKKELLQWHNENIFKS